jgi:hypothetical protein
MFNPDLDLDLGLRPPLVSKRKRVEFDECPIL